MRAAASWPSRVVLVPGALALLPEYAGVVDPVASLRAACLAAVGWLGADGGFGVHGSKSGLRVARSLAADSGVELDLVSEQPDAVLVVGNGSASRSERAPGHFHADALAFDERLGAALRRPDPCALAALDLSTAATVLADVESLSFLGSELLTADHRAEVDYADDPFGVQYWVVRWSLARD